jgi:hypothetical protein
VQINQKGPVPVFDMVIDTVCALGRNIFLLSLKLKLVRMILDDRTTDALGLALAWRRGGTGRR